MKKRPSKTEIKSLFIANRGEIALRIARTVRRMGLEVCGAFSSADGGLPHLRLCHRAVELDGDPARVYLDIPKIIDAARAVNADAIHPGYGFLAENEEFAAAVEGAGMIFVGPTPDQILALGDKVKARKAAAAAGVPTVPGCDEPLSLSAAGGKNKLPLAADIAKQIGYPVLIKAAAGGGGRGMRIVDKPEQLDEALARAHGEAHLAFGDDRVFIEKYIPRARHLEIQVLGDGKGQAVWLGERECSIQRRHQKLLEESPTTALPPDVTRRMGEVAAALAASINYRGAGTMEFIVPFGSREFFFIEMNTRLQVEHPVTEMRTGLDLVEEQIVIARSESFSPAVAPFLIAQSTGRPCEQYFRGHAIEARIIAEDPSADFRPSCGKLDVVMLPGGPGVRVDSWAEAGLTVSPYYDSLLAKVLTWGQTREQALSRLEIALRETLVHPVVTTAPYLSRLIATEDFRSGGYDTETVARLRAAEPKAPGLPVEASVLAAADRMTRRNSCGVLRNGKKGRAMSGWQKAGEQEKL